MCALRIDEGSGSFAFHDGAAGTRGSMRVLHVRPQSATRGARIVIALHGFDRAAEAFRDTLAGEATRRGLIVLVPEFDGAAFPGAYAYNYGNVISAPPGAAVMPRELWTFGIIERLFREVKAALCSNRETFSLFGNSAGAQFVLRYLALNDAPAVDRAVAANSGWYMLPDLTVRYPDGMGGIDLDEDRLRRYFGRNLTILLGEADTDSNAPDLPGMESAMAQGPHRLARGLWYVSHCEQAAIRAGLPFNWTVEIVPRAGHVSQPIYDRGIAILAG